MPEDQNPEGPACPECPDCPECPENPWQAGLDLVQMFVLDTPASLQVAAWRFLAVVGLSGLLSWGWIAWRYPDLLRVWLERQPSPLVLRRLANRSATEQVMASIGSYIRLNRPERFALVAWPTGSTGHVVWSTGDTRDWPVSVDGVLSSNLQQAMGAMLFGECSTPTGLSWTLCPIGDGTMPRGFVISDGGDPRSLAHLADRISDILY